MAKVPRGGTKIRPAAKKRNSRLGDIMGGMKSRRGGTKKKTGAKKR